LHWSMRLKWDLIHCKNRRDLLITQHVESKYHAVDERPIRKGAYPLSFMFTSLLDF
jgi:hypothetical protein